MDKTNTLESLLAPTPRPQREKWDDKWRLFHESRVEVGEKFYRGMTFQRRVHPSEIAQAVTVLSSRPKGGKLAMKRWRALLRAAKRSRASQVAQALQAYVMAVGA